MINIRFSKARRAWLALGFVSSALMGVMSSPVIAADEYIKELYEINCKVCHGEKSSDAPLAFKPKDWAKRIKKKGVAGLVETSITGIGNMPPLGTCFECGPEELEELIKYMASEK